MSNVTVLIFLVYNEHLIWGNFLLNGKNTDKRAYEEEREVTHFDFGKVLTELQNTEQ